MAQRRTYFYLCSYRLGPGSVIEPGNWGRVLRLYQFSANVNNHWLPLREYVFEVVRLRKYAHLPSRLEASFVCETLQELVDFMKAGRMIDLAYEVEILDPAAPSHRGCLSLFDNPTPPTQWTIPLIEQRADAYWSGNGIQRAEVMTMSPLRVLARHDIP